MLRIPSNFAYPPHKAIKICPAEFVSGQRRNTTKAVQQYVPSTLEQLPAFSTLLLHSPGYKTQSWLLKQLLSLNTPPNRRIHHKIDTKHKIQTHTISHKLLTGGQGPGHVVAVEVLVVAGQLALVAAAHVQAQHRVRARPAARQHRDACCCKNM